MTDPLTSIPQVRTRLLVACPFLGHLALRLLPRLARPDDHVATAGVAGDGTLVLNDSFLRSLSPAELGGLLAHEVLHVALEHGSRQGSRDHLAFNIAADASINLLVVELLDPTEGRVVLPPGALIEPSLAGMSAEEIYIALTRRPELPRSVPDEDLRTDLAETADGRAATAGDAAAARRLAAEWRVAVAQAAHAHATSRGELPGCLQRLVGGLGLARLDWREHLRRWIAEHARRQDLTYLRPSRRSESAKALLPGTRREPQGIEVVVMLDTSGSIGDGRLTDALAEIDALCAELGLVVRALVFDAAVHADLEIEEARELCTRLKGGGGSDARPAFERLAADGFTGLAMIFTDGDLRVPSDAPNALRGVLWILEESDLGAPARWGEVLRIPAQAAA